MRIVIVSDHFSERMGYAENCLPKAMAALGHEVHLVTSNAQVYFELPTYEETYESFLGPAVMACEVKTLDGYTLHRLPYMKWRGRLRIKGLLGKIRSLRPDVVQTFDAISLTTCEAALGKPLLNYKLFTGNHVVASVFPIATQGFMSTRQRLKWLASVTMPGRLASLLTEKCYAATSDCADIAIRFFGVQKEKVNVAPLGADTDLFSPIADAASRETCSQLRQQLGFASSEIVCIYTGRFSKDKNPLCLGQAISMLVAQGEPFRGVFIGSGEQEAAIRSCAGCVVRPFVAVRELPLFYRTADIAVWPTQESTSMLDASACGTPIVISDRVVAVERVQGNGLTYIENDVEDLMCTLLGLRDVGIRNQLGTFGAAKMLRECSWRSIARRRLEDYEAALS